MILGRLACWMLRRHKWGKARTARTETISRAEDGQFIRTLGVTPRFKSCRRCSLIVPVRTRKKGNGK